MPPISEPMEPTPTAVRAAPPVEDATERVELESLEALMADLPQTPDGEVLRGVVDALRQVNAPDTASHVLIEKPSRRSGA